MENEKKNKSGRNRISVKNSKFWIFEDIWEKPDIWGKTANSDVLKKGKKTGNLGRLGKFYENKKWKFGGNSKFKVNSQKRARS